MTPVNSIIPVSVRFKTKIVPRQVYSAEPEKPYVRIKQSIGRSDIVDMHAFRTHPKVGGYANSDLARGLILRRLDEILGEGCEWIDISNPPVGVSIDASGFLAIVTIELWE